MQDKCFVQTEDKETADQLRSQGFTELGRQGTLYCFVNDGVAKFSSENEAKLSYTNVAAMVTL